MALKKEITKQIRDLLRQNPGGLSITAIVRQIPINRNTAGRYLENLMVSGQVEMRHFGMAKIYSLAQRVPLSAMLSISSELIMLLDRSRRVIYANEPMLDFLDVTERGLYGKAIEYTQLLSVFDEEFDTLRKKVQGGIAGKEWSGEIAARNGTIIFSCRIAPAVFEEGQRGVSILLENITERKNAEKVIQDSEETLRSLADNSPDTILLTDLEGRIIFINHTFTIPRDDIPLNSIFDFIPKRYHPAAIASFERVVKTGKPAMYESDHHFSNGEIRYFESTVGPVFHDDRVVALVINSRDITDRVLADQDLRESEDRYRSLVEISPDAIFLHQDGQILYMNPAARKLLEIPSLPASLSSAVIDRIPADVQETVRENVRKDLKGELTPPLEFPFLRSDGSPVILDGRGVGTMVGGRPAVQVTLRDITERKKAEDRLRLLKISVDNSYDEVFWMDLSGNILFVNDAACATTGYSQQELCSMHISGLVPDLSPDQWKEHFADAKRNRRQFFQSRHRRRDGEMIDVEVSSYCVTQGDEEYKICFARDITERKKAEDALRESERRLVASQHIAGLGDITWDLETGKAVWSEGIYALLGYDPSETIDIARVYAENHHPEDRERVNAWLNDSLSSSSERIPPNDYRIIRKDGTVITVHAEGEIHRIGGKPVRIMVTLQDITGRKEAEEILRKNRQQLEDAMDMASLYTWEYDRESRRFIFDDHFFTLFGTTAGREGGYTMPVEAFVREFVHPEDIDLAVREAADALKSTGPKYMARREIRIIRRDGAIRNVLALIRILRDPSGKAVTVQGTLQDITDQKRAEDALLKSRQQLEDAMGMANLYTWEYDPTADTFRFNDHLFPLFGTTPEQEGGYALPSDTFLRKFVHPDDRNGIVAAVESAMKSADSRQLGRKEVRIIRRDGEIRNVITLIRIQRDMGQDTILIRGTLQDITGQKRAEAAIREGEATARALINAPADRIILTDNKGKILDLNDSAAQSLGKTRDEILGEKPTAVLSPASAAARIPRMREVVATGKAARFIDEREGVWFDNVIYPVFSPGGEVIRLAIVARDITDQKRSEEALRESEKRYRTLAEASQDIIFLIGQDDTVEYVNSYAAAMLGFPAEQIIGRKRSSFFMGEQGERQSRGLRRVFGTGKAGRSEGPLEMSGSLHWFDHFLMPITGGNGEVTAVLGVSRDITGSRRAEKALAESEERYRDLITTIPDIIWEADIGRRFVYVSPAVEQILGYRPDELIGRSPFEFFDPAVRTESQDAFDNVVRTDEPFIVHDSRWLHKDGHVVILETRARPIIRDDGSFAGFRGIDRDVTGRRQAEEALSESQRRFHDLAELLPQNVWECDIDGKLTFANHHSFDMYRVTLQDLEEGLYVWQTIHPDDRGRVMGDFTNALKRSPEEFPAHHEYTAVRKDGSTFPVLMYHVPIVRNNRIAGMRGIGIDLTGRREMEEALRDTIRSYRLLAENSVDMIYRILPDGICAYMSPAVRSSLGYEPEEFIGHHGSEFLHPDDIPHIIGVMKTFENDGAGTGTDRFRMRHKDGSYIWFDATIRATRDEKTGAIREFTLVSRYAGKSDEPGER